jgi:hypothetical protein
VGLGDLMQAIGNAMLARNRAARATYPVRIRNDDPSISAKTLN